MSEISPFDQAVINVLESSRHAVEEETTERAKQIHEQSRQQDVTLSVGSLLMNECFQLQRAFKGREEFYLKDANWLQRRHLEKKPDFMKLGWSQKVNGIPTPYTPRQARTLRLHNLKHRKTYQSGSLFPQPAELTEVGPLTQDWLVAMEPFFVHTYQRIINTDRDQIVKSVPLHRIFTLNDEVSISQDGKELEEQDYFFPLGLVMEANRQVRSSVSRRISKKW